MSRLPAFLAVLLLAGCAMGPDFKAPVMETPGKYRMQAVSSDEVVNLKWWELFNDPVLYDLVTTALEHNRDLKAAASRIDQARASLGFVRADQYPSVDVSAGASRGTFNGYARSQTTDANYFIAAPLTWEIDFWGKFRRATESARAELVASESALRAVQISLIAEVVGVYYTLLDFRQRLRVSRETLQSRQESLYIIEQRFEKGIIPELDLNQAQIQKEIAASAIPLYERSIAKTEIALSILLGKLPMAIESGVDLSRQAAPPEIPTGLPAQILERRPDVVEAKHLVHAQTANIGVAVALRFPAISLTGVLGAASTEVGGITSEGGAWSVGGSLLGPVFDFNKNLRRVEIEEARTQEALFGYENTVLRAFREVNDALVEIQTYKAQLGAVESQQRAAANANRLSKERYDKGVTSYLEVLETERSLFEVDLQLSELQQLYLNAYVNLYKALGGGWITKEEMEARLQAQANATAETEMDKGIAYRIRVQGRLGEEVRERMVGMAISEDTSMNPPVTTLVGFLHDQAALSEMLTTLNEQKLPLLSVERVEEQ
jgi:multidrug efflux system outer membrane protein